MLHWFSKRLHEAQNEEAGFTLVELLIVCVIIGVLAAIAIPAFLDQREAAWAAACRSDARNGVAAAVAFAADHGGSYSPGGTPMTTADLTDDYGWNLSDTDGDTGAVSDVTATDYKITVTNSNLTAPNNQCVFDTATGHVVGPEATP